MSSSSVLILGARSDIGMAIARVYASKGHHIQLAARKAEALSDQKSELEALGSEVTLHEFDVLATDTHVSFVASLPMLPEIAVCAVGQLGAQEKNSRDLSSAITVMRSNFEGPAHIVSVLAKNMETRGSGTIVGISSVAGDRGRASNYIYGAGKAGFTAFLSGLRNRLAKKGVHIMTVLPGFVNTSMTEGLDLPGILTAEPDGVAKAVERGVNKKSNVIYTKPIWALIMMIIRNIPEAIFKKLSI